MEKVLIRVAWFIGLVLLQVLLLNNISLFGLATPFLYIYLILILDKNINRISLMLIAFALGLTIDIFSNTPGVNAAASVFLAFIRPSLLQMFSPRDEFENFEPGIHTLGIGTFVRYVSIAILLHHTAVFLLEVFSFANIGYVALRILCSTLLTVMMVITIDFVRHHR